MPTHSWLRRTIQRVSSLARWSFAFASSLAASAPYVAARAASALASSGLPQTSFSMSVEALAQSKLGFACCAAAGSATNAVSTTISRFIVSIP